MKSANLSLLPLESNPAVMNKYLKTLGLVEPRVQIVDVFGITDEFLEMVPKPIYALLFVYPITATTERDAKETAEMQQTEIAAFQQKHHFFFTKQYVPNACGTVALIHALINNYSMIGRVEEGSVLQYIKDETEKKITSDIGAMSSDVGKIIAESDSLTAAHAEAAEEGATENQSVEASIYLHFVCFTRIGDRCVEFDGRHSVPRLHGTCSDDTTFLKAAAHAIQDRMNLNPRSLEYCITAMVGNEESK